MSIFEKLGHITDNLGLTSSDQHESSVQDTTPVAQQQAAPVAPIAPPVASLSSMVSSATAVSSPESDAAYQHLVDLTNFDNTSVAKTIQRYMAPLAAIAEMDDRTKFKAALANAKAQENVTEDSFLATFDDLKQALNADTTTFQQKAQQFTDNEITARQTRLSQIADQMASLQAEQQQVTSQLSDAQSKSTRMTTAYNSAVQRRAAELDSQKASYAHLLGH